MAWHYYTGASKLHYIQAGAAVCEPTKRIMQPLYSQAQVARYSRSKQLHHCKKCQAIVSQAETKTKQIAAVLTAVELINAKQTPPQVISSKSV